MIYLIQKYMFTMEAYDIYYISYLVIFAVNLSLP